MGSKCSCLSTQQELGEINTNTESIYSPTTSANRRFSIPTSPLRLSEVFKSTTSKYQRIELIDKESKDFDDFDLNANIDKKLDIIPSYDIHETINYLICGYIRNNINDIDDLTLFLLIKKICYQYYNHYLLFNMNDKNDNNYSMILSKLIDEKLLLDLLCNHWKSQRQTNETLLEFCLPIIHLQNDNLKTFDGKCDNILLIIRSTNGDIFGGFTSIPYSNEPYECYDKNAFLWSLTSNKVFGINNNCMDIGKENIFYYDENDKIAMQFGNGPDLLVHQKCCVVNTNQSVPYSFDFDVDELIGTRHENGYFTVKEMEIFKVYGI